MGRALDGPAGCAIRRASSRDKNSNKGEFKVSKKQETTQPKPSDYAIDIPNSEIAQALADLIEMGLVVDSGQRRFQNGKWRIVWVAVPPEMRGKQRIARRKI